MKRLLLATAFTATALTGAELYRRTLTPPEFQPAPQDHVLSPDLDPVVLDTRFGQVTLCVSGSYRVEGIGNTTINVSLPENYPFSDELAKRFRLATNGHLQMYPTIGRAAQADPTAQAFINTGLDYDAYTKYQRQLTAGHPTPEGNKGYYKYTPVPDIDQVARVLLQIIGQPTPQQRMQLIKDRLTAITAS